MKTCMEYVQSIEIRDMMDGEIYSYSVYRKPAGGYYVTTDQAPPDTSPAHYDNHNIFDIQGNLMDLLELEGYHVELAD